MTLRILVAAGDAMARAVVTATLQGEGHTVTAVDPATIDDLVAVTHQDLAIVDDAVATAAMRAGTTPLVLLAAAPVPVSAAAGAGDGAGPGGLTPLALEGSTVAHLAIPFAPHDLLEVVEDLIAQRA